MTNKAISFLTQKMLQYVHVQCTLYMYRYGHVHVQLNHFSVVAVMMSVLIVFTESQSLGDNHPWNTWNYGKRLVERELLDKEELSRVTVKEPAKYEVSGSGSRGQGCRCSAQGCLGQRVRVFCSRV